MKYLLDVLSNKRKIERTPIWFMRQAGRYLPEYREIRSRHPNFIEFVRTPHDAAEVTLQPLRRFDLDAAIIFSDILIVPYALGQAVTFKEGEGPILDAIRDQAGVNHLSWQKFDEGITPTLEAIAKVSSTLPNHVTLIGFAGAPWTVLTYMIEGKSSKDFMHTLQLYYKQPQVFQELLKLIEQATLQYLLAQVKAGAEVVQIFDSWAGSVPNALFDGLVIQPHQRIMTEFKKQCPQIPVICFPRGIGEKLQTFAEACHPDALSVDAMRSMIKINNTVMQGGLDPSVLSVGGEVMRAQADRVMSYYKEHPYIFNLGHGIQPTTPVAHVEDLVQHVRSYQG
jgi:uroporphyrinogen decarboxylase